MTDVVVEIGPVTVRGPGEIDAESARTAVECIDDELALLGDDPVDVGELWRGVLRSAVGDTDSAVVVCPTWWSVRRVDLVRDAARSVISKVVVRFRASLLGGTVVEIASDLVAVYRDGAVVAVAPRDDDVVASLPAAVGGVNEVTVDAPVDVPGATALATALVDRLRVDEVVGRIAEQGWALRTVSTPPVVRRSIGRRAGAVLAGATLAVATSCFFVLQRDPASEASTAMPMTLLVEGRVGVMVPATWPVRRITSGPGSARLQLVSPSDDAVAVHLTQSPVPSDQTLSAAAEVLQSALDGQPDGIFVDFNAADRRAGKAVITYRELRTDQHTDWVVLVDRSVRIAVGCQSAPGHEEHVQVVCDRAVASAHAVF